MDSHGHLVPDIYIHGHPVGHPVPPVERLLEIYEDIVEVLLVLEIFLTSNA